MIKSEMIRDMMRNWERSNNPDSRFYNDDRTSYFRYISALDMKTLREKHSNSIALHSERFERMIERETNKMDRAGMFNVRNMKPENALD